MKHLLARRVHRALERRTGFRLPEWLRQQQIVHLEESLTIIAMLRYLERGA